VSFNHRAAALPSIVDNIFSGIAIIVIIAFGSGC
jgi:hypothetical protein